MATELDEEKKLNETLINAWSSVTQTVREDGHH